MTSDLWIMIMAGGSGTRFWPASRRCQPKQLLPVVGQAPLLRQTIDRVLPLAPPERILIVAGRDHGQAVRDLCPDLPQENILLEPMPRNTAAACGLGAWWVKRLDEDGVMAVLPADHLVIDADSFRQDLLVAAEAARGSGRLITFGIKPTRPETGYGYLKQGQGQGRYLEKEVFGLDSFKEKPDRPRAEEYLARGDYFWNSGMFVWEAEAILGWIDRLMPELAEGLSKIAPALMTPFPEETLEKVYPSLPAQSIDYGVMEKAEGKCMIVADFDWSDVGSWEAVCEIKPKDQAGNAIECQAEGQVLALDSENNLVQAGDRLVALLGVKNLVVVETEDALLVMDRSRAQEVGRIIDALKKRDRDDLL